MSVSIATKGIINAAGPGFTGGGGVVYRDKPITKRDMLEFLRKNINVSSKLSLEIEDDELDEIMETVKFKPISSEDIKDERIKEVRIIAESKDYRVKTTLLEIDDISIKDENIEEEQKIKKPVPGQTINSMEGRKCLQ